MRIKNFVEKSRRKSPSQIQKQRKILISIGNSALSNNFRIKSFYIAKTLQIKSGGNNNDEKCRQ